MPSVRFCGTVFPTVHAINLKSHPGVTFRDSTLGITASINVFIESSNVEIRCELNQFQQNAHLGIVSMFAYDAAKGIIDLLAFRRAIGLTFVMDQFTDAEGVTRPFVLEEPSLRPLSTSVATPEDFNAAFRAAMTDQRVFLALRDLVEAIDEFHEGPIKCGRCVDSIRATFVPLGGRKEDGWPPLRKALRVSEEFLKVVMTASQGPRHGDRSKVRETITMDVTRNAWIVMDRFLEYHKRGKAPLPESEFPIL